MARKRFVSPAFFQHAELYEAEVQSGLPLRLGFQGLWCQCDRRGLFAWKPRELKLQILPYDTVDFAEVLDALNRFGFVTTYTVNGKRYGCIPTLAMHQNFHPQEKADPTIPGMPPRSIEAASELHPSCIPDASEMQPRCSRDAEVASNGPATATQVASNAASTTDTTTTTTASTTASSVQVGCSDEAPAVGQAIRIRRTGIQSLTPAEHRQLDDRFGGERRPAALPVSAYAQQEQELRAAALPHESMALDALLRDHPHPDALILELYSFASGMKVCRGETTGRNADVCDVMRAVAEMAANGAAFSVRLFRGYLRRVADQKPEPATAEERLAAKITATAARTTPAAPTRGERNEEGKIVAVPIVAAVDETEDQIAARRKATADAVAHFRQQFRLFNPPTDDPPADFPTEDAA